LEPASGAVLLRVVGTGAACGFDIRVGAGRAIVIAAGCPCGIALFRTALERLGATAALRHDCPRYGIFMTSTAAGSERFVHILNLDNFSRKHTAVDDRLAVRWAS
jgi:beta-galactosidase